MLDSNLILNIVKLNGSIEKQYQKLIELDLNNKCDTEEYNECKRNISMCIPLLRKDYYKLAQDPDDYIDSCEHLFEINELKNNNYIDHIIEFNDLNRVIRTLLHLYYLSYHYNIYSLNSSNIDEYEEPNYDDLIDFEFEEDMSLVKQEADDYLKEADKIEKLKEEFLAYTLYDKVLKFIKKEKNEEIKRKLIIMKYNLIYSFIPLEEDFLTYEIYESKADELREELKDLLIELDDEQVHNVLEYQIDKAIEDLLDYQDDDYNKKEIKITIKLKAAYAKALTEIEEETKRLKDLKKKRNKICKQLKSENKNKTRKLIIKTFGA